MFAWWTIQCLPGGPSNVCLVDHPTFAWWTIQCLPGGPSSDSLVRNKPSHVFDSFRLVPYATMILASRFALGACLVCDSLLNCAIPVESLSFCASEPLSSLLVYLFHMFFHSSAYNGIPVSSMYKCMSLLYGMSHIRSFCLCCLRHCHLVSNKKTGRVMKYVDPAVDTSHNE